jgi:Spy/CpxP family protein refolding chaperone
MKSISSKTYSIAIIVLLLLNLGLVGYLVFENTWHKKATDKPDTAELFAQKMELTKEQRAKAKEMREGYFKVIRPMADSLRAVKIAFYSQVNSGLATDSVLDNYQSKINDWQRKINKQTFDHFREVRAMLTPEQQPKFDEFLQKMMQRNRRDSGNKK